MIELTQSTETLIKISTEAEVLRKKIKTAVTDFIDKSGVVPGVQIETQTDSIRCGLIHNVRVKIFINL